MANYDEIICDAILRNLKNLSWRCQGCLQARICEDQTDGGEPRYCWPIIEAAILNKKEWKTEHRHEEE